MPTERWSEVAAEFERLAELDTSARGAALAELATADPALAREVEAMLVADAVDTGPLERGLSAVAAEELTTASAAAAMPPPETGPWRMLERRGVGGMGEVWLAERADGAFEQRVAVKLLKRGMDSEELVARFQCERQILARLEHPAIARLLDGGTASDGRPYLVLEWVEGRPITEHCAQRGLPVEGVLRLFLAVVEAVEFAHRRLIVHRDLKPSNILVDAGGAVKLLDFGIAKLLDADGRGEAVALTQTGMRLLTPAYAAPEQLAGEPVTTATDLYSLGVLLFELLTGQRPAGAGRVPAERPSSVVAKERARRLRGDLDTIVQKALAPEPERRYGSAEALADDLRRHRDGRPVLARPDTVGYRFGRFVGRHRVAVAAAVLVLLSLVLGLTVALTQAARARRQALRAERVSEFLVSVFESVDPEGQRGARVTAREVVGEAARRFERELAAEPEVQAELFGMLARAEGSLGLFDQALVRAQEAIRRSTALFGAGDPRCANAKATLASVLLNQGKAEEAERVAREGLSALGARGREATLARARLSSTLANTLQGQWRLAEAEVAVREAISLRESVLGRRHMDTAESLLGLAIILGDAERFAEAEALFDELGQLYRSLVGPDHLAVAAVESGRATLLEGLGRLTEAETVYRTALEIRRRAYGGEDHLLIADAHQMLGIVYHRNRRFDLAESEARAALAIYTKLAPEHYEIANSYGTLGLVALGRGRFAEASGRMREALQATIATEGTDSVAACYRRANLGGVLAEVGSFEESEALLTEARAGLDRLGQGQSTDAIGYGMVLGYSLRWAGRIDEAISLHREALHKRAAIFGPNHREVRRAEVELALDLLEHGDAPALSEARTLLAGALALCAAGTETGLSFCETALVASGRIAAASGDLERAVRDLTVAHQRFVVARGEEHPATAEARALLGQFLLASHQRARGRAELEPALRILRAARGSRHLATRRAEAALAAAF